MSSKKKKYLTPQGFGRKQMEKQIMHEYAEDLELQQQGYRIEHIGPFKRVEDPHGGVTIEAKNNTVEKELAKQKEKIKSMNKLLKKSYFV